MDGQEAALRLMAWTFGFYAFMDSPSSTPERIAQFTVMVAAHAERIYKNIDYAISTHSNHTISEAFGLWLVGILFPELKDSEKYLTLGRKFLEQEAAAQIFPDGSYSMYSLNYHRFILHIYLYAMRLGELNGFPFSESLRQRVTKSIDYLYQLIDPGNWTNARLRLERWRISFAIEQLRFHGLSSAFAVGFLCNERNTSISIRRLG